MKMALGLLTILLALVVGAVPATGQTQSGGKDAYLSNCAGCHGSGGAGTTWAPSILEEGAAGADFMMRTGRMPLTTPDEPIRRRPARLTAEQMSMIARYVAGLGGPVIPEVHPTRGDPADGARLYLLNCAACHGSTGVGGAMVDSRNAPSILQADPIEIAEAIRSGPGPMPRFDQATLDQHELDSIVRYVVELNGGEARGGWALGRWGPVAEGAAAWLIGIFAVVGAAFWIEGSTEADDEMEEA